jgi:hypothetical protein
MSEPLGDTVLQPDSCGPGQVADPHAQACLVEKRLQLGGGNRGPGLAERQRIGTGRPGRQQPPGRPLAKPEREQQSSRPGHDLGRAAGEIGIELSVGQDHLDGVRAAGPPDAGLGPHRAGRSVAAGHETEDGLPGLGPRPQNRPHPPGSFTHLEQLGAALHLHPTVGQGGREHRLDVHLPDQRQVRESGIRQRKIGEPDAHHPAAQVQVRRGRGVCPGQQRLRHLQRAQHLQRAGMHDQGAGRPERLRPPIDDPHIGTVVMGQGQGQAGRPGTGHQDAGRARHNTAAGRHQAAASAATSARTCGRASSSSRRSPGSTT